MAKKKKEKSNRNKIQPLSYRWTYAIISLLAVSIYANTLFHGFVLDDAILITENVYTKKGLSGLSDIFSHDTFHGFFQKEGKDKLVSGGRYRPFSQAMFALEYNLGGLNPFLGHLVNILLYVFTVCSLLYILLSFCKDVLTKSERWFFAGICTLLFAVHPIHTEVVANIKGRDEILVFLGGLWSIYFATRFLEVGRIKYGFFSGLTLLIALFSKENAIAFLAVIPMTLYFFKQKNLWQIVKATLPAMLATVIYLSVRYLVVGLDLGGEQPLELMNNPFLRLEDGKYIYMTASEKYPLIIFGLIKYLQLLFFPYPLTHDYYPKFFADLNWTDPVVLLSVLLLISLGILTVLFARRQKIISYAILFFFATILLTSNLFFSVGTHLSERFLFTPSLAWALLVTSFLYWAIAKIGFHGTLVAATLLTVIFAFKTIDRNRAWKSN